VAAHARAGAPARALRAGAAAASRRATGARRRGARPRRRPSRSPPAGARPAAPRRRACPRARWHPAAQAARTARALQHEAKRARVCQVQERQRIVQHRLQRVRKAAECRVACVEGRLAARAGEAQRVARQRLTAHAATQGTRGLLLSGVRGHEGTPKTFVVKEAERNLGDGGGRGVIFFEGSNKLVLIAC
jgi:hypothetical protein